MKKNIHSHAYPLGMGTDSRTMLFYFGISFFIHLSFIGTMVLLPESAPRQRFSSGSINVSLVSLPGPPASAPAPAAKTVVIPKPEVKKTATAPVIEEPTPKPLPVTPQPPKTVSLAPEKRKWKVKTSLKKKTLNRRKMIDHAVSGVQNKVEKSKTDSVNQAIAALKKKVAQTEANPAQTDQTARAATGTAGAGTATGSGGKRALDLIDIYKIEVAFQVERHWAFSEQLAGDGRALQASLVFRVLPSGEVTDIRFTERSGNTYLDESAHKAIVKAGPVSPHPEGVRALYVTVALRFTPQGIR
jgi:colicin import membrane protein